jgi:hypothetical protein
MPETGNRDFCHHHLWSHIVGTTQLLLATFISGTEVISTETLKGFGNNYLPIFIQSYNKVKYSFTVSLGSYGFYRSNQVNGKRKKYNVQNIVLIWNHCN